MGTHIHCVHFRKSFVLSLNTQVLQQSVHRVSHGHAVVNNPPSKAGNVGSILGQGAKIPHASWPKKPKHKTEEYCQKSSKDLWNGPHHSLDRGQELGGRMDTCICMAESLCCSKLAQHYESAILQYRIKSLKTFKKWPTSKNLKKKKKHIFILSHTVNCFHWN